MTQENLQDALMKDLEALFQHDTLSNSLGVERAVRVHSQDTPIRAGDDEEPDSDALPEPYVVVRQPGGEMPDQGAAQKVETVLVICVYDPAPDRQGYRDALHIVNTILHHYGRYGILGKRYVAQYPIKWVTQDDDTHPYYFAGLALSFDVPAMFKEEPET